MRGHPEHQQGLSPPPEPSSTGALARGLSGALCLVGLWPQAPSCPGEASCTGTGTGFPACPSTCVQAEAKRCLRAQSPCVARHHLLGCRAGSARVLEQDDGLGHWQLWEDCRCGSAMLYCPEQALALCQDWSTRCLQAAERPCLVLGA